MMVKLVESMGKAFQEGIQEYLKTYAYITLLGMTWSTNSRQ